MPRYRPASELVSPGEETLPLDTLATIIPRQSKKAGAKNNVHSQELADHELLALATAHGFVASHVRIDKRDMGISANTTTIDDRPALREWLRGLLPSGASRVVIFSQEDRAFRDEEEIELNTFIREVKRHRGWVICGHKVYRLWEEYDADMFRMLCKYAAKYVAHHVRGRLIPAVGRAAQRGLYDGRGLNVGYVVDYDPASPNYKRYVPYRPHATLVLHEIFERFARMPYPSVPALVRAWNAPNGMPPVSDPASREVRDVPTLYFPALPPEMDRRVWNRQSWGRRRAFPPYGIDDPLRRGWLLREQGARRILSNVFYLGWVARGGFIMRGERLENGQVRLDPTYPPLVLHEPIVQDEELFWYCFDRVSPYTIEGRPNPKRRFYTKGPRQQYNDEAELKVFNPRPTRMRNAANHTLLLLGKVRCDVHGHAYMRHRVRPDAPDYYLCKYHDDALGHRQNYCTYLPGVELDGAVVRDFLDRLRLSEEDVVGIARAWQVHQRRAQNARHPGDGARRRQIEAELANLATGIAHTQVEAVRSRLVVEMERLTAELEHVARRIDAHAEPDPRAEEEPPSIAALHAARTSAKVLDTLRTAWDKASLSSRQALMQWVVESVKLVPAADDRKRLDGCICWRGGQTTSLEVVRAHDRRMSWDAREREVLQLWYLVARWPDLEALLPGRSREAITVAASRMKLATRPRHAVWWNDIPPAEKVRLAPQRPGIPHMAPPSTPSGMDSGLLLGIASMIESTQ
jgi:hypothetical protein